jgi:hypothetical protein
MVAPAKQSKHRERSQWTARDTGYVLATLALARVVPRDLVVSQNKNFGRNPSWSYVKPVVTRGSTVCCYHMEIRYAKKLSLYGPRQAKELEDVEIPRISRQSAQEGGKAVSPTHWPPLPPGDTPGTHLSETKSTLGPECGRNDYVNEKSQWPHRELNPWHYEMLSTSMFPSRVHKLYILT